MKVYLSSIGIFMQILLLTNAKEVKIELKLYSQEDVCRYFPDNVVIRKPGSCQETIKCFNGKSEPNISLTCADNEVLNLNTMECIKKDSKDNKDNYCKVACAKNSPKWIEDKKNCNEWHECNGATLVKSSSCPQGLIFIQDKQLCDYDNYKCNRTYDICDVAPNKQKFWDEYNCHKYFFCDNKMLKSDYCNTTDYYNIRTGECTAKALVDCYKHPIPNEVCGNKKLAIRNRFVNDEATCRGYFYCKDLGLDFDVNDTLSWNYKPDLSPDWGQCPMGEFFDEKLQACRNQNYVKCEEDRCDSRSSGMILSEEPGCQQYLICQNGHTEERVNCTDHKYFDPLTEDCVDWKVSYPICA